MPKAKKDQAVLIAAGRHTLPPSVVSGQYDFIAEMGPYLKQAGANNEEAAFYVAMFKLWFSYWPEVPTNKDDVDFAIHRAELTKKACKADLLFARVTKVLPAISWQEFIAERQKAFDHVQEAAYKPKPKRSFEKAFLGQGSTSAAGNLTMGERASLNLESAIAFSSKARLRPYPIALRSLSPEYTVVEDSDDLPELVMDSTDSQCAGPSSKKARVD